MLALLRIYPWLARSQWVILTAIATYLSLISDPGPVFVSVWDKLLHVICWFFLTLSLRVAWQHWPHFYGGAVGLFAYSVLIEVLQMLNPNRQFGFDDAFANGIGIIAGYFAAQWTYPHVERLLKTWKLIPN